MLYGCRYFTPFLFEVSRSRVQASSPERHFQGRNEDISQCKIVHENFGDGLHLRVFIYDINNQCVSRYRNEANQCGDHVTSIEISALERSRGSGKVS